MLQYWLMLSLLLWDVYSQHIAGPVCNIKAHQYTIIDIKASVAHGATLLNGTLVSSLDDCVEMCCGIDLCDLAVFKNNGTSRGNRNCYFVHCGADENCLLVSHINFTTVSLKKGGNMDTPTTEIMVPNVTNEVPSTTTKAPEDVTTEAPNKTIESVNSIATLPPNNESNSSAIDTTKLPTPQIFSSVQHESVPHTVSVSVMATDIVTTLSSSISTDSTSSVISTTSTSTIEQSSTSSPAPTAVVNKVADTTSNDKVMPTSDSGSGPDKDPNSDNRLCGNADCSNSKAAGLVVACLLVAFLLIVVILVVLKKSWERHRSKKYKRIDYLIDGMYS